MCFTSFFNVKQFYWLTRSLYIRAVKTPSRSWWFRPYRWIWIFDHAPFHPRKSIKKCNFNGMLFILANAINIRTQIISESKVAKLFKKLLIISYYYQRYFYNKIVYCEYWHRIVQNIDMIAISHCTHIAVKGKLMKVITYIKISTKVRV